MTCLTVNSDYPAFIAAVENAVAAHKLLNGSRLVIDFRANVTLFIIEPYIIMMAAHILIIGWW
jgi:hypothetical protein